MGIGNSVINKTIHLCYTRKFPLKLSSLEIQTTQPQVVCLSLGGFQNGVLYLDQQDHITQELVRNDNSLAALDLGGLETLGVQPQQPLF